MQISVIPLDQYRYAVTLESILLQEIKLSPIFNLGKYKTSYNITGMIRPSIQYFNSIVLQCIEKSTCPPPTLISIRKGSGLWREDKSDVI
jgi:hypothetical protein